MKRPLLYKLGLFSACCILLATGPSVWATGPTLTQEALDANPATPFFAEKQRSGAFSLSSTTFSSTAEAQKNTQAPWSTQSPYQGSGLASAPGVYALLIDGKYDFNYDADGLSPYLGGGFGLAAPSGTVANPNLQVGDSVPLMRFGGGVAYRMSEGWNLSLDYQAGATAGRDALLTKSASSLDNTQSLGMGLKYKF